MKENRTYHSKSNSLSKLDVRARNAAVLNSKAHSPSNENNLRFKRRLSELQLDLPTLQTSQSKVAFGNTLETLEGLSNFQPIFQSGRSIPFELSFTSLKFYLDYNFGKESTTDIIAKDVPHTTRELASRARSRENLISSPSNEGAKTARNERISPQVSRRLSPIFTESDAKSATPKRNHNSQSPSGQKQKPQLKIATKQIQIRKLSPAELMDSAPQSARTRNLAEKHAQSSQMNNAHEEIMNKVPLRNIKTIVKRLEKGSFAQPHDTEHNKKMEAQLHSPVYRNNSGLSTTKIIKSSAKEELLKPFQKHEQATPSKDEKSDKKDVISNERNSPSAETIKHKEELRGLTIETSQSSPLTPHKFLKTPQTSRQNSNNFKIEQIKLTSSPAETHTRIQKTDSATRPKSRTLQNSPTNVTAKRKESADEMRSLPSETRTSLPQVNLSVTPKLEKQISIDDGSSLNGGLASTCLTNKRSSFQETNQDSESNPINLFKDLGAESSAEKLPNSINNLSDPHSKTISRLRSSTNDTPKSTKQPLKRSPNFNIENSSSARKAYSSKKTSHALKFNFTKSSELVLLPETKEEDDSNPESQEKVLSEHDENQQTHRSWHKARSEGIVDDQTPVEDIWNKGFKQYSSFFESKVTALSQYRIKELTSHMGFNEEVKSSKEEPSSLFSELSPRSPQRQENLFPFDLMKHSDSGHPNWFSKKPVVPEKIIPFTNVKYMINIFSPVEEPEQERPGSTNKLQREQHNHDGDHDDANQNNRPSSSSSENSPNELENAPIAQTKANAQFEFFLEKLEREPQHVTYSDWEEIDKIEFDVSSKSESSLHMLDDSTNDKSFMRFKLRPSADLFFKIFAYLLRKFHHKIPNAIETKLDSYIALVYGDLKPAGEMTVTNQFIFTPKFERSTNHIIELGEDGMFLFELIGELPEKLIPIVAGYNENLQDIKNDENKFLDTELPRFKDNELVEMISVPIPTVNVAEKSPLILGSMENQTKLYLIMRNNDSPNRRMTQAEYRLKDPDVMLKKISELEKTPHNPNNAYVLELLETHYQYGVFGAYESEIELKEYRHENPKNAIIQTREHANAQNRRSASILNLTPYLNRLVSILNNESESTKKPKGLRRRSKTATGAPENIESGTNSSSPSPLLPKVTFDAQDIGTSVRRRAITKAAAHSKGADTIHEEEEDAGEKNNNLLPKNQDVSDGSKANTSPREELKNQITSLDSDKIKHLQSNTSDSASQISKKQTESDTINFAPTRMWLSLLSNDKPSYDRLPTNVGTSTNDTEASTKIKISKKFDKNDDSSGDNEKSPLLAKVMARHSVFRFQKRATIVESQKEDTRKARKTVFGAIGVPSMNQLDSSLDGIKKTTNEASAISPHINESKPVGMRSRYTIHKGPQNMDKKILHKRNHKLSIVAKNNPNPVAQMFAYIQENRMNEFEQVFRTHASQLIDCRDGGGNTLLIVASQAANKEIVELILAKNPDLNAQNDQGNTALHVALMYAQTTIADILISYGARQNIKNADGKTPWEIFKG